MSAALLADETSEVEKNHRKEKWECWLERELRRKESYLACWQERRCRWDESQLQLGAAS